MGLPERAGPTKNSKEVVVVRTKPSFSIKSQPFSTPLKSFTNSVGENYRENLRNKGAVWAGGGPPGKGRAPGARRPEPPPYLSNFLLDVCGVVPFSRSHYKSAFITHMHKDHLPLRERVRGIILYTGRAYVDSLKRFYGEACEYTDVLELDHTYPYEGKIRTVKTYGFFIKEVLFIPECDNPEEILKEYSPKVSLVCVSRQSRQHPVDFKGRDDVYIVDNGSWFKYKPNVIPKVVFSEADRQYYGRYILAQKSQ